MYTLPLLLVIVTTIAIAISKNGVGSFVTLGIFGAAIYTVPALADTQVSLATIAMSKVGYIGVPDDVKFVVLISWLGLFSGLVMTIFLFPKSKDIVHQNSEKIMKSIALASLCLALIGIFYLSQISERPLFFLVDRADQDTGAIAVLWKWTALIGIISSILGRERKLAYFHIFVLFLIFLRGDRTLVTIAAAAVVAIASYKDPKWYAKLRFIQITGMALGAAGIFFGKSVYLILKSGLTGRSWDVLGGVTYTEQFMNQFEPFATFNHIEFVMRTGTTIGPGEFVGSILGNILLVPSFFGISTNVYSNTVSAALSSSVRFGIAGNYLAHGYTVGGTLGAALFYFILPVMLRLCDGQFRKRNGTVKVFWCAVGAVIAFYIHRNGLDNLFSFVRQLFIVAVATAAVAAALRRFGLITLSRRRGVAGPPILQRSLEDDFVLSRPAGEPPPPSGTP